MPFHASTPNGWRAKTNREIGMTTFDKNIFVSHIQEDESHIGKMKELLAERGFSCRDSSVTSETPNNANNESYIRYDVLSPQIRWASTVIVLITPGTKNSDWVNWEIEHARSLGKRIVGVWVRGEAGCDAPEALEKYADSVVAWNADGIIDAINGKTTWECADGTGREPRVIDRIRCQ